LALAPDASSASTGRELSSPAKWVSAGANEGSVWGEAKGSGTRPYQTAIDLGEHTFHRDIGLVHRASTQMSEPARALVELIAKAYAATS